MGDFRFRMLLFTYFSSSSSSFRFGGFIRSSGRSLILKLKNYFNTEKSTVYLKKERWDF